MKKLDKKAIDQRSDLKSFKSEKQILISEFESVLYEMENESEVDSVEKEARVKTHNRFLGDKKENKMMDNLIRDMVEARRKVLKRKKVKESIKNK